MGRLLARRRRVVDEVCAVCGHYDSAHRSLFGKVLAACRFWIASADGWWQERCTCPGFVSLSEYVARELVGAKGE